jgi:phytoene/squalene synthetase
MMTTLNLSQPIAPRITKAASEQTFYTIRFLADRGRVADAYKAYAYFRWVDDTLDADLSPSAKNAIGMHQAQERLAFLHRQKTLLETCYRGEPVLHASAQEQMLIELVRHDQEKNSGLQSYLRNMMQVMEFDARRCGRLISYSELKQYTRWLAVAVTEAMHYFIGHDSYAPRGESRYLAVSAAHITHMLRDTYEDVQAGYYNIPREVLEANHIGPEDAQNRSYRAWVCSRVQLARSYFKTGREYLARVQSPRCRLAGMAYTARFEWLLDTIENEQFLLRPEYSERKSLRAGVRMGLSTLTSLIHVGKPRAIRRPFVPHSLRKL